MTLERRSFGTALRTLRQRHERTLREVAETVKLSVPYVSDMERDRRNPPSLERMADIASLFPDADAALMELVESTIADRSSIELTAVDEPSRRLLAILAVRLQRGDLPPLDLQGVIDILEQTSEGTTPYAIASV